MQLNPSSLSSMLPVPPSVPSPQAQAARSPEGGDSFSRMLQRNRDDAAAASAPERADGDSAPADSPTALPDPHAAAPAAPEAKTIARSTERASARGREIAAGVADAKSRATRKEGLEADAKSIDAAAANQASALDESSASDTTADETPTTAATVKTVADGTATTSIVVPVDVAATGHGLDWLTAVQALQAQHAGSSTSTPADAAASASADAGGGVDALGAAGRRPGAAAARSDITADGRGDAKAKAASTPPLATSATTASTDAATTTVNPSRTKAPGEPITPAGTTPPVTAPLVDRSVEAGGAPQPSAAPPTDAVPSRTASTQRNDAAAADAAAARTNLVTASPQAPAAAAPVVLDTLTRDAAVREAGRPARSERTSGNDFSGLLGAAGAAPQPSSTAVIDTAVVNLPTNVTSPEFKQALGVQVSLLAKDGIQHAELHLNPADMGPISIQIVTDGTQARVDFGADSAQTRQIIESGLPELASAMRDAGLTLTGGGVSQHARGGSQQEGSGSKDGSPRGSRRIVMGADTSVGATRGTVARAAAGNVDLYA